MSALASSIAVEAGPWVDVGPLDAIPVRGARVVKTRAGCIAVFRTAGDEVFALADRCPHRGGPLSEGIVHGRAVTCPLHNWLIALTDGRVQGPDEGQVPAYPARVDGGRVLLDLSRIDAALAAE